MYYICRDHVAIVSEELWERAQTGLKRSRHNPLAKLHALQSGAMPAIQPVLPSATYRANQPALSLTAYTTGQPTLSSICPKPQPPRPEVPALTLRNYPYKDRIFCKYCGSRLRRIIARNRSVWWICNGLSRKGKAFCKGIRIPDGKLTPLRSLNVPVYIGKEPINGKETYGYSTQPDERK